MGIDAQMGDLLAAKSKACGGNAMGLAIGSQTINSTVRRILPPSARFDHLISRLTADDLGKGAYDLPFFQTHIAVSLRYVLL